MSKGINFSPISLAVDRSKPTSETIDLSSLDGGLESYVGPHYRREPEFLQELVDYIATPGNILHKRYAYRIVLDVIDELKKVIQMLSKLIESVIISLSSCLWSHLLSRSSRL